MDNKPTTIEPQEAVSREPVHTSPPSSDLGKDMHVIGLSGFFDIAHPTGKEEADMKYILEYFVRRGVNSMPEILLNMRHILGKMGPVEVTISKLGAITRYLKTTAGIEDLMQQKKSMEQYG